MQEEVRDGLRARDRRLPFQSGERRLPGGEEGHVAERRDAPGERGPRAAREVVHPLMLLRRPTGRRREMDVRVDPAGQEQATRRVDLAGGAHLAANLRDRARRDADICRRHRARIDDPPAPDYQVQLRHRSLPVSSLVDPSVVSIARRCRLYGSAGFPACARGRRQEICPKGSRLPVSARLTFFVSACMIVSAFGASGLFVRGWGTTRTRLLAEMKARPCEGHAIEHGERAPTLPHLAARRSRGEFATVGQRRASIFCVSLLIMLLLPLDATAAIPSGPSHKIVVDSADSATLKQLAQSGATLLADYGSFSLWRTSDAQKQAVASRASVKARDDFDIIPLRGGASINTVAGAPAVATNVQQTKSGGKQLWMVQFVGPIKQAWLARLRKLGIEVVAYMPNNAYVIWLDGGQLTQLEQQAKADPTVQWTGAYHPAYRIAPPLQAAKVAQAAQPVAVTIQLYKTTGTAASVASLRGLGGTVLRGEENILDLVNITLEVPGNQIAAIAGRADVFNIEPYTPPKKNDEVQGQIVAGNVTTSGANVVPTGPGYRQWLIDHGFADDASQYPIVDVVDDGIDDGTTNPLHPDFHVDGVGAGASRVIFNNNCTPDAKADGQAGHGNLNAGIVGGYNNLTGAPYRDGNGYDLGIGISPFGRVAGTKIFTNTDASGNSFFDESACGNTDEGTVLAAATAGATITSNSWGASPAAAMTPKRKHMTHSRATPARREPAASRCCMSSPPGTTAIAGRKPSAPPAQRRTS